MPTVGKLPETVNEIALDTIVLDKLGIPHELGQPVTLEWRKDLRGTDYIISDFILCGYWEGNHAAIASMAWVSNAFAKQETVDIDIREQINSGNFLGVR